MVLWAGQGSAQVEPHAGACVWEAEGEQRLELESGAVAYVEPQSLAASPTGVLHLGFPTYVYRTDSLSGTVPGDSIVGVLWHPDGSATGVPSPVPDADVSGFSAVATRPGTWSVAFAILRPGTRFPEDEIAEHLGFGLFDGTAWRNVETQQVPEDVALHPFDAPPLVRDGDAWIWALPTRGAAGRTGVAVLRRTGGEWTMEVEAPSMVLGLSVAALPERGGVIAVMRSDLRTSSARPGGMLQIELAERLATGAAPLLRVETESRSAWHPTFDRTDGPRWIGWLDEVRDTLGAARIVARAAPLRGGGATPAAVLLDDHASNLLPMGALDDDAVYWVSTHEGEGRSIRVMRVTEAGSEVVFRTPNPYHGPFGATAVDSTRILLTGPRYDPDATPPLSSLIIQLRRSCAESAPQ